VLLKIWAGTNPRTTYSRNTRKDYPYSIPLYWCTRQLMHDGFGFSIENLRSELYQTIRFILNKNSLNPASSSSSSSNLTQFNSM
jgi:hypothetical protein